MDTWSVKSNKNTGSISAEQADNVVVTRKGWVEGLKIYKIPNALRKGALELGLDINIQKESGLLSETVYYTVTGKYNNVERFQKAIHEWAD